MTPIGSRRINDVYPSRYSPADFPSRTLAAPAKKRIWSTPAGISSSMVSPNGFPVFSDSARTSSSARSSMASAILSSASCLSEGVVSRHVSKALLATSNALSMSAWLETGAEAKTSLVAGLIRSEERPSEASTYSPPTKFCSFFLCVSTMCAPFSERFSPLAYLVPAPGDDLAQPFFRSLAQGLSVGEDHSRKFFSEQPPRRASGQRRVGAEVLAHADPDLAGKTAEGVGGKEDAIRVPQERDVPKRVARRGDDAKSGDEIPFTQHLRDRRGRHVLAARHGPEEGARGLVRRASAGDDLRLVLGSRELRLRRPLDQALYAAWVVGVVVRHEDVLEVLRPGTERAYGLLDT